MRKKNWLLLSHHYLGLFCRLQPNCSLGYNVFSGSWSADWGHCFVPQPSILHLIDRVSWSITIRGPTTPPLQCLPLQEPWTRILISSLPSKQIFYHIKFFHSRPWPISPVGPAPSPSCPPVNVDAPCWPVPAPTLHTHLLPILPWFYDRAQIASGWRISRSPRKGFPLPSAAFHKRVYIVLTHHSTPPAMVHRGFVAFAHHMFTSQGKLVKAVLFSQGHTPSKSKAKVGQDGNKNAARQASPFGPLPTSWHRRPHSKLFPLVSRLSLV